MTRYTHEDREQIRDAARQAIEDAEHTLDQPRPDFVPPVEVEDRVAKWRREANEQAERFACARAEPSPLTEWEMAQAQRDQLSGMVEEQKRFQLDVLAEVIAEVRHEFNLKIAELNVELGQLRADLTIAKALAKSESSGEVLDLPNPFRRRVA
jgi:hypothetical protein